MEKYNGNQKGFIYVSCDEKNRQEAFDKYLEPLSQDGVPFWWADGFDKKEEKTLARAKAVLLFLTKDYAKDKKLRDTLAAAVRHNKPVLCIYLEDVELDAAMSMQTEAQQALFVNKYKNDEEFVKELKKAAIFDNIHVSEEQKKQQKGRTLAAVAAAVIVLIAAIVIIKPLLTPKANAETMAALGLQGLSKDEMESIEELHVAGADVVDGYIENVMYDNGNTSRIIYYNDEGEEVTTATGTISDLSGLGQLTNLRSLQLEGQQIEDITPLLELENLEELSLNCNPVSSLDGLENLKKLRHLDISYTNVRKLPDDLHVQEIMGEDALNVVPDFTGQSNVSFFANQNAFADVSNLSTAESYEIVEFEAHNDENQIITSLTGIPVREFNCAGMQINNPGDVADLTITKRLDLCWSTITSLDGLEKFEGIQTLKISHADELTDLTPANNIQSLREVIISSDMEELAEQLDNRIVVRIED